MLLATDAVVLMVKRWARSVGVVVPVKCGNIPALDALNASQV